MNEIEQYVYFEGELPASIRPLVAALREAAGLPPPPPSVAVVLPPPPSVGGAPPPSLAAETRERVLDRTLAGIGARLRRMRMGAVEVEPEEEQPRGSAPPVAPAARVTPPWALPTVDEQLAAKKGAEPLGFETWAMLSSRFLGVGVDAYELMARKLTLDEWRQIDADYMRVMSADQRAGRRERPALFAAKYDEEMARRAQLAGARAAEAAAMARIVVQPRRPELTGTGDPVAMAAAVWAVTGKLPFTEAAPGPPDPTMGVHGVTKTKPVPVVPSNLGATMPHDAEDMRQAVAAATPFAGSEGVAGAAGAAAVMGVVYYRELTLQQYASLRVDLAASPAAMDATLEKYGVPNRASWWALDAAWRRYAEWPGVWPAIQAAEVEYKRWRQGPGR